MANKSPIQTRTDVIKANGRGAGRANVSAQKARIAGGARAFGIHRKTPGGAQ